MLIGMQSAFYQPKLGLLPLPGGLSPELGLTHIALPPMKGAGSLIKRIKPTNVDSFHDCPNLKANSAILTDMFNNVWSTIRLFILMFRTMTQHNLITNRIGMGNARGILAQVILPNKSLLARTNIFPIRYMRNIKNHIPTKHKLARSFLQGGMVG